MTAQSPSRLRKLFDVRVWGYGLFWSWNLIFLAFMALGFAPQVLPSLIDSVRISQSPPEFLLYAVVLTLIPLASVLLALTVLRREPGKLLVLGYGVEGPLMLILALRFFVVREATAAVTLMLVLASLGMATLALAAAGPQDRRARSPCLDPAPGRADVDAGLGRVRRRVAGFLHRSSDRTDAARLGRVRGRSAQDPARAF